MHRRIIPIALLCIFPAGRALAGDAAREPIQWIAVVAPGLKDEIRPLCDLRRQQGAHVVTLDHTELLTPDHHKPADGSVIRQRIASLVRAWHGPSCVLLAGNVCPDGLTSPSEFIVPALPGTVARMTNQPSDNGYGLPDDKLLPRVAVGRLPARTAAEARGMVSKILAWENDRTPGLWKRHMTVLAGAPSYNRVVDKLVEDMSFSAFDRLRPAWHGRAIVYNRNSPYALPDDRMLPVATQYLAQRQALLIYLGHSAPWVMWCAKPDPDKDEWRELFTRDDWARLTSARGILVSGGCFANRLLGGEKGEGYGLFAMRNPNGPVAVIGSHGECWAAMVMLMTEGLLPALPRSSAAPTLGELWLAMKENLAGGTMNPLLFSALNNVDGDPKTPQDVQRREHQEMFVLLGDPAIRMPRIEHELHLKVSGDARPGAHLHISASLPPELDGASGDLTLDRPVSSHAADIAAIPPQADPKTRDAIMLANHQRANQFTFSRSAIRASNGHCEADLEIPASTACPKLILRLYIANNKTEGRAVRSLTLQPLAAAPATSRSSTAETRQPK